MNKWLRKMHIFLQGFWFAATSWKHIKLAEDIGECCNCHEPINPLGRYLYDFGEDGLPWHGRCARWRLKRDREFITSMSVAS